MATFVFYADAEHKRRADGRNTLIAAGADAVAARAAAEALIDEPGALAKFAVVQLSDASPAFIVEGHHPVGSKSQSTFPSLTRGGDFLRG